MAISRYSRNDTVGMNSYGTWDNRALDGHLDPNIAVLEGLQTEEYVYTASDRLDLVAYKFYNEPSYYWIIALANNIQDPFSIEPGTVLKIPTDVRSFVDKVL